MKQYLSLDQTAKLIELGLPKPISVTRIIWSEDEKDSPIINANTIEYIRNYSIGELIEMLGFHLSSIHYIGIVWAVNAEGLERRSEELIDALYDMIVKLKEEGVI